MRNLDGLHQPVRRTADTIAAQRESKQKGSPTLAICNVLGSMITREAAGSILTHAGPEIGVASTKSIYRAAYCAGFAGGVSRGSSRSAHRRRSEETLAGIHFRSAQD